jgi:hypothetical protein
MIIANIQESSNSTIVPLYYKVYNKIIPKIYDICKFWTQLSGVAAYAVITRIGKILPISSKMALDFPTYYRYDRTNFYIFIYRVYYFQTFVLIPQVKSYDYVNSNLVLQINVLNEL